MKMTTTQHTVERRLSRLAPNAAGEATRERDGIECVVLEIAVDWDALALMLAMRARKSRIGRTVIAGGIIRATVLSAERVA
jgi:hypothetical protein